MRDAHGREAAASDLLGRATGVASDLDEPSESEAWRPPSSAVATTRPRFVGYPFTLGVASGAPTYSAVVLWTRLVPRDSHATFACDLRQDAGNEDSPVVATEVCGTSITSQGRPASQIETMLRENPDIRYADSSRRGYTVVDITPGETRVAPRVLDDAAVRMSGVSTARSFTIERDRPGLQD